jgi:hypothetical protein
MNLHEIEEMEYRFGPKLWDAGEGVCCAAYQLGGDCCNAPDYDEGDELSRAERVELYGEEAVANTERILADLDARRAATQDEEPF